MANIPEGSLSKSYSPRGERFFMPAKLLLESNADLDVTIFL